MRTGTVTGFISRNNIYTEEKEIIKMMFGKQKLSATTFDGATESTVYNLITQGRMYFVNSILVINSAENICREAMINCAYILKRFLSSFAYNSLYNICVISGIYDPLLSKFIGPKITRFILQFFPPSGGYSCSANYPYSKFIVLNQTQRKIMIPIIDDWSSYLYTPLSLLLLFLRYINLFVKEPEKDEKAISYLNYDEVIDKCREILAKSPSLRTKSEASFCSNFGCDTFLFLVTLKLGLLYMPNAIIRDPGTKITGPNTYVYAFRKEICSVINVAYDDQFIRLINYYKGDKKLLFNVFRNTVVESRLVKYFKEAENGI